MTTQINVTVGGVELPAQARRGQEGNRWRLEQTEQQRQTTAQQQAAQAQQAADVVTGTPSGRGPGYGYRPDELAASRRMDERIGVAVWSAEVKTVGTSETTTYRISNAARTGMVELTVTTPLTRDRTPIGSDVTDGDPNTYDGTRTITYTAHDDHSKLTTEYLGFLPVGNGSILFLAIQRTAVTRGEYYHFYRLEGTSRINQYGLRIRKAVTTETTSASYYIEESNTVKCALVTNNGVKEIQPTAAVLASIEASYPSTATWAQYDGATGGHFQSYNGTAIVEDLELDGGTAVLPLQVTLNTMVPFSTLYPYKQPPTGKRSYPLQGLARHYGMGDLTTNDHRSHRYWTPAEYGQLNPFAGVDYGTDETATNLTNYQQFRATFLASTPAPPSFLDACLTPGSCPTEYETFFRTRQSPVDIFTAMEPAQFRPVSRRVSTPPLQPGEGLAFVWDWGVPAFCRQQLLALGFTEADLTP